MNQYDAVIPESDTAIGCMITSSFTSCGSVAYLYANRELAKKTGELDAGGGLVGFEVLVEDANEDFITCRGKTEVDLDYMGGDLLEGNGDVGLLQPPSVALPGTIRGRGRAGAADERDGIATVVGLHLFWVEIEVVEEPDVAGGFELNESADPGDSYLLGVDGNQCGRGRGVVLNAAVFFGRDAEFFVVGQDLAGMLAFVFREPLPVGGDGVVEPEEDGVEAGGHTGAQHLEQEGGFVESRVNKMEGGDESWAGGEGIGLRAGGGLDSALDLYRGRPFDFECGCGSVLRHCLCPGGDNQKGYDEQIAHFF